MNLHIVPDNTFINKFYDNLEELGLTANNKIIVRSNEKNLKAIRHNLPFAPLYSSRFSSFVGNTAEYDKVFVHYFTPLLWRWVATHTFQELNWMVWGGDLYNIASLDHLCYEPTTLREYVRKDWSVQTLLYRWKVLLTQEVFRKKAYAKVKNILTWMHHEYQFVLNNLPVEANHKFFFYENQFPYGNLDVLMKPTNAKSPTLIIGNSGYPTNNHLEVVRFLEDNQVNADLCVPVSYGNARYISFLKKKMRFRYGRIEFIDRYMRFEEYVNFLASSDGLVMNTIRPQGYGNILMMQYMNKPVFFNDRNISLPDLSAAGIKWYSIAEIPAVLKKEIVTENKQAVLNLLSHAKLLQVYKDLFS